MIFADQQRADVLGRSGHPHANGCKDNGMAWPTEIPTLTQHLVAAGYRTASVGKMHFWPDDRARFGIERRVRVRDKGILFDDDYKRYLESKGLANRVPTIEDPEAISEPDFGRQRPLAAIARRATTPRCRGASRRTTAGS